MRLQSRAKFEFLIFWEYLQFHYFFEVPINLLMFLVLGLNLFKILTADWAAFFLTMSVRRGKSSKAFNVIVIVPVVSIRHTRLYIFWTIAKATIRTMRSSPPNLLQAIKALMVCSVVVSRSTQQVDGRTSLFFRCADFCIDHQGTTPKLLSFNR
jgi:hypothetical protein